MMMWETRGHSDGKKVPQDSRAIACHISLSSRVYFFSPESASSAVAELSPSFFLDDFDPAALFYELLKNLSSVPTQK